MSKIQALIVGILIVGFLSIFSFSSFNHTQTKSYIDEINYNTVDIATSLGILNENLYDYLLSEANKHSRGTATYDSKEDRITDTRYVMQIKLDKQIKPGVYDTFTVSSDYIEKMRYKYGIENISDLNSFLKSNGEKEISIIGLPLGIGDKITIYLEDRTNSLFGQLLNMAFLNYSPDDYIDNRIKSVKSGVVANNPDNVTIGYDVISNINKYSNDPLVAISVQTKLSNTPRYYGNSSHPALVNANASTRLTYGNSSDEKGDINISNNQGRYFIFGNGMFKTNESWQGNYRLIEYIQQ